MRCVAPASQQRNGRNNKRPGGLVFFLSFIFFSLPIIFGEAARAVNITGWLGYEDYITLSVVGEQRSYI